MTRPDTANAVRAVARQAHDPAEWHCEPLGNNRLHLQDEILRIGVRKEWRPKAHRVCRRG